MSATPARRSTPEPRRHTARRRRAPRRLPTGWALVREILFYLARAARVAISLFPFYWILRTSLESDAAGGAGRGRRQRPAAVAPDASAPTRTTSPSSTSSRRCSTARSWRSATTAVTIVVASLAGYALARLPIRGAGAILGFILVAGFFPVLAMVGPLFLLLQELDLLDNIYPLIIVYLVYTLPIATWLLQELLRPDPERSRGGGAGRRRHAPAGAAQGRHAGRRAGRVHGRRSCRSSWPGTTSPSRSPSWRRRPTSPRR